MPLTGSVECEWINKSPLPTNVSDTVNASPPYTLDIDDSGGNNSCSLSDVAECSIILDKNTPPSEFLPDSNTVYTSGDTRIFSQSHPLPLINEHKHPFGLNNPKFQCFFNSVLQLIFSLIFWNNSYTSPFNSSMECTLLKYMLQTAHNACNSKDVNALKFQLVHHDIFYNGQNQGDSTGCLLMLINIIHKGSMPDSSLTTSPMGASLSDILFSFVLEKHIVYVGPSIDSGHYTASINCCKRTFYCNDHKLTEFGITDKNSSTAYIILYEWIDTWFLDSNRRVGVWSLRWRWHILSIPLTTGRGTSAETCGLDDVFPPDDLGSRPEALC